VAFETLNFVRFFVFLHYLKFVRQHFGLLKFWTRDMKGMVKDKRVNVAVTEESQAE